MGNCTHYRDDLFGLIEHLNSANTLNLQNCVNLTWNCVHNMHRLSGFVENLNTLYCVNSTRNCVHNIYEFSRFIENLNYVDTLKVQNCINPLGHCVH